MTDPDPTSLYRDPADWFDAAMTLIAIVVLLVTLGAFLMLVACA